MEERKCSWKSGSRIKADPNEAFGVFESLRKSEGLSPRSLVEASRPDGTVFHGEFEWNDEKAAEEYRINQASHIIRSFVIVHEAPKTDEKAEPQTIEVRAYLPTHNKEEESRGTYESLDVIVRDDNMRMRMMKDCLSEIKWVQSKYRKLQDIVEMLNVPVKALQEEIAKQEISA